MLSKKVRKPIIAPKFLEIWSIIAGFDVAGLSLWPFVFMSKPNPEDVEFKPRYRDVYKWKRLLNHESIHWYQTIEMGVLLWYFMYFVYYYINLWKYKVSRPYMLTGTIVTAVITSIFSVGGILPWLYVPGLVLFGGFMMPLLFKKSKKAYLHIPFEKEAYENQHDYDYLDSRESYSWVKYL